MYKYDALYRLVEATGRELTSLQLPTHEDFANNIAVPNTAANAMQNYEQQFTYDELGNILQMKSVGNWTRNYFYNTNDNKLLGHTNGVNEYTYDNHGNITAMPHLSAMVWDSKDQLIKTTKGTESTYYCYDASGERVRKVTVKQDSSKEERLYLGSYEVYREIVNSSVDKERTTVSVNDDTKRVVTIDTLTIDGGSAISTPTEVVRYQYDNHLRSASLELDETAAIISYEEYHPFGTTSYRSGRTETEVSLKRYKYVGKERDEETGLYYYGARYYAAWLGRFVSVDPMKAERTWVTPYNYVQNNPINRTDPTGALDGDPPVKNTDLQKTIINTDKHIETGLSIGGNSSQALFDLQSILPDGYSDKVSIVNNNVYFDLSEKEAKISEDLGVETLYNLVNSNYLYYFAIDDKNTIEEWKRDIDSGDYLPHYSPLKKTEYLCLDNRSGVSGATKDGAWNIWISKKVVEVDKINRKGDKIGTKRVTKIFHLEQGSRSLRQGVDNERVIAPLGKIFNIGDETITRPAVILHELREMFYQTEMGMFRDEAHAKTIQDVRKRIPSKDKRYDKVQTY